MKTIHKIIDNPLSYSFEPTYSQEDLLFFDIETTGFSPERSSLYLIGCAYYKDNNLNLIQWFADDEESEILMLHLFFQLVTNYKVLIHFNGDGFDIPYLKKKAASYNINHPFDIIQSFDIYKKIYPYKKLLKLDNLKQKTIEKYLDIERDDKYTGGELIEVYHKYKKLKHLHSQTDEILLKILLLHNEDDLKGMLKVCSILNYSDLIQSKIKNITTEITDTHLTLKFDFNPTLPKRISTGKDSIYFNAFKNSGYFKIELYKNELKFFYTNYKDYYYLPEEDQAIHKSVAFYVDKDFRTKAKAANCYSKKTGLFIPQLETIIDPYFKIDYFDKETFIELTDDFLSEKELLKKYINHLLKNIL